MNKKWIFCFALEQAETGAESCNDFLNSEGLKDLNEAELCVEFGLDPETLRKEFSHLFSNILHVFKFLKTGNVEAQYQDSEKLNSAEILDNKSLDYSRDITQTLDIATILKMLIIIHGRFKTTLLFSKQGLTRIPYYFNGKGFLNCNFDDSHNFQLITKQEIELEAFSSCRIKFQFSLYLKQMLIFSLQKVSKVYKTRN